MLGFWSHLLADTANELRKESEKKKEFFFCSGYLYAIRSNIVESVPENILVEEGQINLLDPVSRYIPEFGQMGKKKITVYHLLSHRGGITQNSI